MLDPLRRAAAVSLKTAIKHLALHLEAEEQRLKMRQRQRREVDRKNFLLAVEAVACNLLITAMVGSHARLIVRRGHQAMWGKGRYGNPVYGQHFRDVLDLLEKLGLIKKLTKGYRFSRHQRRPTTVCPTPKLAKHLPLCETDWRDLTRVEEPEVIVLKAGKDGPEGGERIDYQDTRKTRQWRRQMQAINRRLAAAPIDVLFDDSRCRLDRDGQPIDPHRRALRRIFNNSNWLHGGRLFGAFWLTMERAERFRSLRIDGLPIANVDYRQLFPRLAYVRAQAEQPEGDLYDVNGDGSCREGWKRMMNALLFAERPLRQWPKGTSDLFSESISLGSVVATIKRKHAAIAHLFERGLGYELMRIESDMLVSVVMALFNSGITALPLHDAVLVERSHADVAKEFMQEEFTLRSGSHCGIVEIKETPN